MIFESYGYYFLFFYAIKFPFSMLAHLSCCSSNIKLSLGIPDSGDCKSRLLPAVSWGGWGIRRRAEDPKAPWKTWMIDGVVRSLWSKRCRMKGLVRPALTLWLAVGTWRAADQASAASGIKLVFPAQAPSWTSVVLWGGSWWRDFGLSWSQLNQLLVLHYLKNSRVKQA